MNGKWWYNMFMKEIPLSQNKIALIDDDDFPLISKYKWYFNNGYALRHNKMVGGVRVGKIFMHKLVLNTPEGLVTDHINGNTLDNRKANLRAVSCFQNSWNSNIKGVSYHNRDKKWQVRVQNHGKRHQLGYFDTLESALQARKDFIKETRGVYGRP